MKINICSGPNLWGGPDWVHIDRVDQSNYLRIMREEYVTPQLIAGLPPDQRKLSEYLRGGGKIDFRVGDARQPLPFDDGSCEAIYLGQCVEHFNRQHELIPLLRECHRLLAPSGVLRITTPDLDRLLDAYRLGRMHQFTVEQPAYYAAASPADQLACILFGATGPDCTVENYEGHFHIFTCGTMATALTEAGFEGPYNFDWAEINELFVDAVDKGMTHSLRVEATK